MKRESPGFAARRSEAWFATGSAPLRVAAKREGLLGPKILDISNRAAELTSTIRCTR